MWAGSPLGVGCWMECGRFGDWLSVSNAFRLASRFSNVRVSVGVGRAGPILRPRSSNIGGLWDGKRGQLCFIQLFFSFNKHG